MEGNPGGFNQVQVGECTNQFLNQFLPLGGRVLDVRYFGVSGNIVNNLCLIIKLTVSGGGWCK